MIVLSVHDFSKVQNFLTLLIGIIMILIGLTENYHAYIIDIMYIIDSGTNIASMRQPEILCPDL